VQTTVALPLKDINQAPAPFGSNPSKAVVSAGLAYFTAQSDSLGFQLWRSDGTASGTVPLTNPPVSAPSGLIDAGGMLFFTASTPDAGNELWKSDGTAAGTRLVRDITPGPTDTPIRMLAAAGKTLYFAATDQLGEELWKSDGTPDGTVRVKDINPGPESSKLIFPYAIGNTLYFSAFTPASGQELWKSDGTDGGTVLVKDISPGAASSNPSFIASLNGILYFAAGTPDVGTELFRSDGSSDGTKIVVDTYAGPHTSTPYNIVPALGKIFFEATDESGTYLRVTDGTGPGTHKIAPVAAGLMAELNGRLYYTFTASGTGLGFLYSTDGTPQGTAEVKGFSTLIRNGESGSQMAVANGRLFFMGWTNNSWDLWTSDGTGLGTTLLGTFNHDPFVSNQPEIVSSGSRVFFQGNGPSGPEPWISDGTPTGTQLLKDIELRTNDANPRSGMQEGSLLYFLANDANGVGVWRTDGTSVGTQLLHDGAVANITDVAGTIYFSDYDQTSGSQIWKTDGTPSGTMMVASFAPTGSGLLFTNLTPVGTTLYFDVRNPASPSGQATSQLWKLDSSPSGASRVDGVTIIPAQKPVASGGALYVRAVSNTGAELWKIDDATGSAEIVADIAPGPQDSNPTDLLDVDRTVYFAAYDPVNQWGLWRTDGTGNGAVLLHGGFAGSAAAAQIGGMTRLGKTVYFRAGSLSGGYELWKSVGTPQGTQVVKSFGAHVPGLGIGDGGPNSMTAVGNTLYFLTTEFLPGDAPLSLYRTDGTEAGTVRLKTLSFDHGKYPTPSLVSSGGMLYFTEGDELWKTDGSRSGTVRVMTLAPTTHPTSPVTPPLVAVLGNTLLASTYDEVTGREVRKLLLVPGLGASSGASYRLLPDPATPDGPITLFQVSAGSFNLARDVAEVFPNLAVEVSGAGSITFAAAQHLRSLTLSMGGKVLVGPAHLSSPVILGSLSIDRLSQLDLGPNALVVRNTRLGAVEAMLAAGCNNGDWHGAGLTSSSAALDSLGATALGSALAGDLGLGTFEGEQLLSTDVVVRYTYYGDADLNGVVNGDDESLTLYGLRQGGAPHWYYGDFDYSGHVTGDDYSLFLYGLRARTHPL
jgi:ELWxxDGT repeat protein